MGVILKKIGENSDGKKLIEECASGSSETEFNDLGKLVNL